MCSSYELAPYKPNTNQIKVRYTDLPTQAMEENLLPEIEKTLLRTGQFILGQPVSEFEARIAKICQTKYAIGLNSGTDALFLSLKACGIGEGDEVITVPNSFIATAAVIALLKAKPVFVDVGQDYNIVPELIEKAITPRTKAIIPVHLTGNPADMPLIMSIASKYNLYVVEDACQAVGASIDEKIVGSFGNTGCFSLHPLKNLNVWGDGGFVTTNSSELAEKLKLLRNHGLKNRDESVEFAFNSRLDTIQAIVALRVLDDLEKITQIRIAHARKYDEGLADLDELVNLPFRRSNTKQVFHTYIIRVRDRNRLYKYLNENGIEVKVHYPIPLHLQQAAAYLGYKEGDFPECEAQAKSILTLPIHQNLTDAQLDLVIEAIHEFYGR